MQPAAQIAIDEISSATESFRRRSQFQRYAVVRIRQFALRQVATCIGVICAWYFVSAPVALICGVMALVGELVDILCLKYLMLKLKADMPIRRVLNLSTISAGFQSLGISGCVLSTLLFSFSGEGVLFAFCFLTAGAVNAGFILTHHPRAARVKLAVLGLCIPIYFAHQLIVMPEGRSPIWIQVCEVILLSYMVAAFVGARLHSQRRAWEKEKKLVQVAQDLYDANEELEVTRHRAEAAANAKSAFLAVMSHEIRTPLNAICGMSDIVRRRPLDIESRNNIEVIREASTSLLHIVNDILDFSSLGEGKLAIEKAVFSPALALSGARRMFRPAVAEKGLTFVTDCDDTLPVHAMGDEKRIKQIFMNLMSNAIKFTEAGEIRVTSTVEEGEDGKIWVITLTDSGIGVPEDQADAIFDAFHQCENASVRRHDGTGLGLPISRELARQMGGDLALLHSAADHGSTFELRLPLEEVPESAAQNLPAQDEPAATPELQGLRLLVAEDNVVNRIIIEKFLEGTGAEVHMAHDGRAAVEMTRAVAPAVILMDVSMPKLNGLDATREIRETTGNQPYIIAVTANAFASDQAACLAAGMDDFVSKPVDRNDLLRALSRAKDITDAPVSKADQAKVTRIRP